jgi:hypothetical protein
MRGGEYPSQANENLIGLPEHRRTPPSASAFRAEFRYAGVFVRTLTRAVLVVAAALVGTPALAVTIGAQQHAHPDDGTEAPRPYYDRKGTNVIGSEAEALDVMANGGRFILVGYWHSEHVDANAFIELIPTLQRSYVTVLGLELPPSMNGFLSDLQAKVRAGMSADAMHDALGAELDRLQIQLESGDGALHDLGGIIFHATRHGMRVVGIDPRLDDDAFQQHLVSAFDDGTYRLSMLLEKDSEAARSAAEQLAREPDTSRMAILYGEEHITARGKSGVDRPEIISEALRRYATVSAVRLVQDTTKLMLARDNPQNRVDAVKLASDIAARRDELTANDRQAVTSAPATGRAAYVRPGPRLAIAR